MMDAVRWEQVQAIFGAVADLPGGEQPAAIHALCGADEALRQQVMELIQEDARQESLLDQDLASLAEKALKSDQVHFLVQRQIGPYRLLRLLGEGGMGVVYLAERTDIGGLVAVKLLRDAWLSPMRRARFAVEQQMLVKLNHPAIARLYDTSTMEDGTPWFVMEYADGLPLTDYLRARNGSVRDDLTLFRRVCEAVQYAHGHAIIHRDLKPSNILVTLEGEVKLLDFGIAKQMDLEAEDAARTTAGLRMMTPGYAAPEQMAGGDVGVFTDVYSLGAVLYEILTGQLPRMGDLRGGKPLEKPSAVVRNAVGTAGAPAARWQLNKQEWADLDVLCLTALEVDPKCRYSSVDAFLRDITAYLEGRVLQARPNNFAYTARKFVRRNRLTLTSIAASLLLLAVAATVFTVRLAQARDAARLEAARTERIQQFMQSMLGSADEEAGPSNDLKVVTLLDRAAERASSLNADAETQLQLYQTIGSMYNRLGKFEKSEQILKKALSEAKAATGAESNTVAATLIALGTVRGDRGEVKEAKQNVGEALQMLAANHVGENDARSIEARIAMGKIDIESGAFPPAIDLLRPIAQATPGSNGVTTYNVRDSLSVLAEAEMYMHRYDLSESASRRAIELDTQLLGESHPQTGVDLMNLAATKTSVGEFAEGERLYRKGIGILKSWYGADNPDVITATSILGRVLISEGKNEEAQATLSQLLETEKQIYGPVHERVAFTENALGELALHQAQTEAAEAHFSQAATIYRSLFGDHSDQWAVEMSNLGGVYLKQSRDALAETTLKHAVEVFTKLPPGGNYLGLTRGRWGRALLALKRYPEAEQQLLEAEQMMSKMPHPPSEEKTVRNALSALYVAMHDPDKARYWQEKAGGNGATHAPGNRG